MNTTARRYAIAVLTSALILLAYINWHQVTKEIDISPLEEAASPSDIATATVEGKAIKHDISRDALTEILARPLFDANRRQPPEGLATGSDAEDAEKVPSRAPKLIGTMRWGKDHRALMRFPADPIAKSVAIGATIDGWTLKAIDRDFILVEQGKRSVKIPIIDKTASKSEATNE
jgi:hypothetical protein